MVGPDRHRPMRASRGSGSRAASLVEAALVLPVLAILLLGTIDFALVLSEIIQFRHGVRDAARATVVDEYGNEACTLTGYGGANAETAKVLCRVHAESLGAGDAVRVNLSFPDGGKTGPPDDNSVRVCAELQLRSQTGFFDSFLDGRVSRSEVTMRIEQDLTPVDAGTETSLENDWSWCS